MHGRPRFAIVRAASAANESTLAEDVRRGLLRAPKTLPPKHFYDATGSELFDRICELPEYYPTRAEHALLRTFAGAITERAGADVLVEIGSGMARKTGELAAALCEAHERPLYVPFDISPDALEVCASSLMAKFPTLDVRAVAGEFPRDMAEIARAAPCDPDRPRLFAFLGSTIGNLDEREAPALLRGIAALMTPSDAFLLGVDLVKDEATLVRAYDDAAGVTAAFNKNVLARINRELDADFDLDAFEHEAVFDRGKSRIEMRLVSKKAQRARVGGVRATVELCAGERILTEISRKFTRDSASDTLRRGGMTLEAWIESPAPSFALCLARRAA